MTTRSYRPPLRPPPQSGQGEGEKGDQAQRSPCGRVRGIGLDLYVKSERRIRRSPTSNESCQRPRELADRVGKFLMPSRSSRGRELIHGFRSRPSCPSLTAVAPAWLIPRTPARAGECATKSEPSAPATATRQPHRPIQPATYSASPQATTRPPIQRPSELPPASQRPRHLPPPQPHSHSPHAVSVRRRRTDLPRPEATRAGREEVDQARPLD